MKKVWVNRFNVNGEVKLMSEWRLKECNHNQSHAYQIASGNYAFNYEGLPPRNCLIAPEGRIEEGGVFFEYIGNQVGDGWFYIERNEIPPFFDVEILLYKMGDVMCVNMMALIIVGSINLLLLVKIVKINTSFSSRKMNVPDGSQFNIQCILVNALIGRP